MLSPDDVRRVVEDASRLALRGELVVFGSGAFAFWLESAPATRDVDVYCLPAERGDAIEALMGELSWYHERTGAYVEVWSPETFRTSCDWRTRAKILRSEATPELVVTVAHPHDVVVAKLERCDERDKQQIKSVLEELPLSLGELDILLQSSAHERGEVNDPERVSRFRHWAAWLKDLVKDSLC